MVAVREQESAEAVVPRATSRETPRRTHPLGRQAEHDHRWSCPRSDEADRLSIRAATSVAEKEWLLRPLRTARNRRTRTRMYGGVGAGRGNPPGDPIRRLI